MRRLTALVSLFALLPLLSGCAAPDPPQAAEPAGGQAQFPAEYEVVFRLEAFQGEERTSYSRFAAARTARGFYYAASTGERCLFLKEGDDAYAYYIWDPGAGRLVQNQGTVFSGQVLAGFQRSLLHLDLLAADVAGLTEDGTAAVAGRTCRIYRGAEAAGPQFQRRRICCLDAETGLALSQTTQYVSRGSQPFTYLLTCERFSTQDVSLPEPAAP